MGPLHPVTQSKTGPAMNVQWVDYERKGSALNKNAAFSSYTDKIKEFCICFPAHSVVTLSGSWGFFRWAAERALFWRNWAFDRENMKVLLFVCTPEDSYLQGCNKRTLMFIPGCSAEVKYNLITVLIWALVPPHYNSPGQLRCSRRRKRLIWFVKCFTSTGRGWRGGEKTNERGRDVQS